MQNTVTQSIDHVQELLHRMADKVCEMVLEAVEGVVTNDTERLQRVIAADPELDAMEEEAVLTTFRVIVLQAPVAKDARFFAGVLSIISELENAGDDAVKLARRGKKMKIELPEQLRAPLGALAESTIQMVKNTMDLVNDFREDEAEILIQSDELIDSGYKAARKHILTSAEEHLPFNRELYRMIEMFHALEHIADHMVEIAKRLSLISKTLR